MQNSVGQNITTSIIKSEYGWKASTTFTPHNNETRRIKITTARSKNWSLVTKISVSHVSVEDGRTIEHFNMMLDFFVLWNYSEPDRITQKAVEDQHQEALASLDEIVTRVTEYYKNPEVSNLPSQRIKNAK